MRLIPRRLRGVVMSSVLWAVPLAKPGASIAPVEDLTALPAAEG